MAYPYIHINILNWNQAGVTLECLDSISKIKYDNFETVVIDNGSTDNSVQLIRNNYPGVHIIENNINLGCCEGRNVGIRYSLEKGAGYIFLLDNDTIVDGNIIQELLLISESDPKIGVAVPMIYYFDRKNVVWTAGGLLIDWPRGRFIDSQRGQIDNGQFAQRDVDTHPEGFSFVKREVFERAGLIDPDFFFYYEGGEWSTRVKRKGYRIVFVPQAKVWHKVSFSHGEESPKFYYLRVRNRLLFMRKSAVKPYRIIFSLYFIYDFLINILLTLYFSKKKKEMKAAILGIIDFVRGVTGDKEV